MAERPDIERRKLENTEMTAGRIPKHDVSAWIEREDYEILRFAGWNFSAEIREFCHASADIYRRMIGRGIIDKVVSEHAQAATG